MNEFFERIKDLRINKDISQMKLVELIGILKSIIAKWELEQVVSINFDYLIKIAKYFKISAHYLLALED